MDRLVSKGRVEVTVVAANSFSGRDPMKQEEMLSTIYAMKNNPRPNYITPGLNSYLIGDNRHVETAISCGQVRLFEMTRPQEMYVSPHSHRFDFCCLVLDGKVTNHLYVPTPLEGAGSVEYRVSVYDPNTFKEVGLQARDGTTMFRRVSTEYIVGEWYGMKHSEFHSIDFEMDARVLFFEGPRISGNSLALEPVVNGKVIPLFKVEPWMYNP